MIIENAIRNELLTPLSSFVGTRIYYATAPQDVDTPYVVFLKVSDVRDVSLTGTGNTVNARFQFSVYADTYYETKQIAEAIRDALQGKCQEVIGGVGGVTVNIQFEDETDIYDPGALIYHLAADYFIQYNE